jgi:glucose/arabinose dehydrogenase/uncharacterized cupredoxin-like copper-binding protein
MRTKLHAIVAIALTLLILPLSALAQEATPETLTFDLSTETGLLGYQEAQADITAEDVGLPEGFDLELVAGGLSFPDAVAVADDGTIFAALSGFGGTPGQVVIVNPDGTVAPFVDAATAGLQGPITDITFGPDGTFWVAHAGGIATVDLTSGAATPLITGLPSLGDHQNNQLAFGDDGWIYFGQGTVTNSMVVGPDNAAFGWLPLFPEFHDVPCEDVTIEGTPFESPNVLTPDPNDVALTSPYQAFGVALDPGAVVPGAVPCNGAVLRFQPADPAGTLEVFAWGLRNPYGVVIDDQGALWVIDNGPDARGSRPIENAPDAIYRIEQADAGAWYGYPDFFAGFPVTNQAFAIPGAPRPLGFIIANHDDLLGGEDAPAEPMATLAAHSGTGQGELAPESWGEMAGHLLVASHGDFAPVTGTLTEPRGHAVYVVHPESGEVQALLQNPSPKDPTGAVSRPVGLAFSPDGSLYIADLGVIETSPAGILPRAGTGAIWRVVPSETTMATPEVTGMETPAATDADLTDEDATPAASAMGETVSVSLMEFAIDMPTELPAGPTTFEITNDGTIEHNFEVEGQGIEEELPENLAPGASGTLTVDLEPGTYEVYFPVGNHADEGMRVELTVTAG